MSVNDPPEVLLSDSSVHWQNVCDDTIELCEYDDDTIAALYKTKHWLTLDTEQCAAVGLLLAPALHLWRHKVNITPQSDTKYSQRNITYPQTYKIVSF